MTDQSIEAAARGAAEGWQKRYEAAEGHQLRVDAENKALRAALRNALCPNGGYARQPPDEYPSVDACLKFGVCGCDLGAALTASAAVQPQSGGGELVGALRDALTPFAALADIKGGTPAAEKFKALLVYMMEHNKPGDGVDIIYQFTTACLNARAALTRASPAVEQPLAEFVRWAISEGPFEGCDLDGGGIQDKAEKLGILIKTKYDPALHGETDICEPGDDWLVFAPWVPAAPAHVADQIHVEPIKGE